MSTRRLLPAGVATLAVVALAAAAIVSTGNAARSATFKAGLVSDVGRFNDKGFNQAQLIGLQRAKSKLGVQIQAIESRSAGDYVPNFATLAYGPKTLTGSRLTTTCCITLTLSR